MKKHYRKENDCLNCGATLQGNFCHVCGQENLEMKETFSHMMSHAVSDYFHFDYQFFHTLKPLILQPGKLTNEYMAGHRAAYLHPVKMYIFISVVYFLLLFQNASDEKVKAINQGKKPVVSAKTLDSVSKAIAKDSTMSSFEKSIVLSSIKKGDVTIGKKGEVNVAVGPNTDAFTLFDDPATRNDTSYQQYLDQQKKLPASQRDGIFVREVHKRAISYKQKYGSRAKEVFWDEFKHNVPKMMFLMLPIFALILKIAFSKNHKLYVEHMIYSFHLHCFLFLFMAMLMLVQMVLPSTGWHLDTWMDFIATFFIIWYIYKSLRVVYHRSWGRTISKMIGISFAYYFAFVFCLVLVVFITAITMSA